MLFPKVRLVAERLVLRGFEPGDAGRLAKVVASGDREALPAAAPASAEALADWLDGPVDQPRARGEGIHLAIVDAASGDHIGAISLRDTDWVAGTCEVGYGIRRRHQRKGYATEALTTLADWALDGGGMRRIELTADVDNLASIRVAEKAGFQREGTLQRDADLGMPDLALFALCGDYPTY